MRTTSKHLSFVIYDAAGASITAGPGEGDLSFGEVEAGGYEAVVATDRGTNEGWFEGNDRQIEGTITVQIPKTDPLKVARFIAKAGEYAGLTSVNDDVGVMTFNAEVLDGDTPISALGNARFRVSSISEGGAETPASISIAFTALKHVFGGVEDL